MSTKAGGNLIASMVRVDTFGIMECITKVNLKTITVMEWGYRSMRTVRGIKENGFIIKDRVRER